MNKVIDFVFKARKDLLSSGPIQSDKFKFSKLIVDRLNNVHPIRKFAPVADEFIRIGELTESFLNEKIEACNSSKHVESVFEEARVRLTTEKRINLNPTNMARAIRSVVTSLCPSSSYPKVEVLTDIVKVKELLNLNASSGYPDYKKKKLLISDISRLITNIVSGTAKLEDSVFSVFTRTQVKDKGDIALRLFFAPSGGGTVAETMFGANIIKFFSEQMDSPIFIGKTQRQICEEVHSGRDSYVYSFDYSKYDQTLPREVMCVGLAILESMLVLDSRFSEYGNKIKQNLLHAPYYHPKGGVLSRVRGLPSGSFFTNILGSVCNLVIVWYALHVTEQGRVVSKIRVHGDDLVIVTHAPLDSSKIIDIVGSLGLKLNLDEAGSSKKGEDSAYFLGSLGSDGVPFREDKRLIVGASTVRSIIEFMPKLKDVIEGRIYSIFGYSQTIFKFWKQLGYEPFVGRKLFVYSEGLAWEDQLKHRRAGSQGQWLLGSREPWFDR